MQKNWHFTDDIIWGSYLFTFKYSIVASLLTNLIALGLALLLNSRIKAQSLLREILSRRVYFDLSDGMLSITAQESEIGTAKEEVGTMMKTGRPSSTRAIGPCLSSTAAKPSAWT